MRLARRIVAFALMVAGAALFAAGAVVAPPGEEDDGWFS